MRLEEGRPSRLGRVRGRRLLGAALQSGPSFGGAWRPVRIGFRAREARHGILPWLKIWHGSSVGVRAVPLEQTVAVTCPGAVTEDLYPQVRKPATRRQADDASTEHTSAP